MDLPRTRLWTRLGPATIFTALGRPASNPLPDPLRAKAGFCSALFGTRFRSTCSEIDSKLDVEGLRRAPPTKAQAVIDAERRHIDNEWSELFRGSQNHDTVHPGPRMCEPEEIQNTRAQSDPSPPSAHKCEGDAVCLEGRF